MLRLLHASASCKGAYISTSRSTRRVAVVLKSPFHYKLPKHHLKYGVYTHRLVFMTKSDAASSLARGLIVDTPYRVRVSRPRALQLIG